MHVTPLPSSQTADPRQAAPGSWSGRAKAIVRRRTMETLSADPHFRELKPSGRRLVRILVAFHDPQTGKLGIRTKNTKLMERCECSESTLKRARHECIEAGFIIGYKPGDGGRGVGDGGWAGTYTIARTREEAALARALRKARKKALDSGALSDIPYWPVAPEREPLTLTGTTEQSGQSAEKAPGKGGKRPGNKPVAPAAPKGAPPAADPMWARPPEEVEESRARGIAAARAELERLRHPHAS